ncbi:glycoside hydrolase family 9 protein [Vibrio maerlii]|uniref:glycoside hydrolase family 9 protein n=1 Tax=Vibrio maerlii TaxID=2231648 RepID=UPI000E3BC4FD|nr:glycoside hydrolase family 9 protein [Vibrio maerlii]
MQLLINQIGYESQGPKQAILSTRKERLSSYTARLVCADNHMTVATLDIVKQGTVAKWHQGNFYSIDFSEITQTGRYYVQYDTLRSDTFELGHDVLQTRTLSDLLHYFKSQRCGGIYDKQDSHAPILNSDRTVDVHGGWYDASGDVSKYLSHLSYANFLNPQQIPMVAWNMLKGLRIHQNGEQLAPYSKVRLAEEALYGADFLVRMQDAEGYFYMTVFDKWSKDTKQRDICAYATQDGHKSDDYQAGFRQGGGVSIAALAAASQLEASGDHSSEQYLARAEQGYWHLKKHNVAYLNDGQENIIDEYCALLASVELYRASQDKRYLDESALWADKLALRQQSDQQFESFWSATDHGERPYYHAAEAGLPVIALCEYLSIETDSDKKQAALNTITNAVSFELAITNKVTNPFGYPRQYVKSLSGDKRDAFFVAHDNESGYWWQGENARLGSLAAMAYSAYPHLEDEQLRASLLNYAHHALNWIVGLNPYDMCMLDGHGKNNPDYLPQLGFFNAKGGICNGITGGFDDEEDIAFNPAGHKDDMLQNWRWGEQWIPHGAWFLLAVLMQSQHLATEHPTSSPSTNEQGV